MSCLKFNPTRTVYIHTVYWVSRRVASVVYERRRRARCFVASSSPFFLLSFIFRIGFIALLALLGCLCLSFIYLHSFFYSFPLSNCLYITHALHSLYTTSNHYRIGLSSASFPFHSRIICPFHLLHFQPSSHSIPFHPHRTLHHFESFPSLLSMCEFSDLGPSLELIHSLLMTSQHAYPHLPLCCLLLLPLPSSVPGPPFFFLELTRFRRCRITSLHPYPSHFPLSSSSVYLLGPPEHFHPVVFFILHVPQPPFSLFSARKSVRSISTV